MPVQTWECEECGYIVAGTKKPGRCPECGTLNSFVLSLDEEDENDLEDIEEVDEELEDLYDEEDEEEDEEDS